MDQQVSTATTWKFWRSQLRAQIRPNTAKYAKYGIWALNMAKWGIPEKILHNAVHTC